MKKIHLFLLLSIICINCKEMHCPAFPTNLNYFPYYNSQELKFIDSHQNENLLVISKKENSKKYTDGRTDKALCYSNSYFIANFRQDSLTLECEINISGKGNYAHGVSVFGRIKKNNLFVEGLSIDTKLPKKCTYKKIDNHLGNTLCLENENNKLIKRVVIVKNKGLVSYTTADGVEWKLVE